MERRSETGRAGILTAKDNLVRISKRGKSQEKSARPAGRRVGTVCAPVRQAIGEREYGLGWVAARKRESESRSLVAGAPGARRQREKHRVHKATPLVDAEADAGRVPGSLLVVDLLGSLVLEAVVLGAREEGSLLIVAHLAPALSSEHALPRRLLLVAEYVCGTGGVCADPSDEVEVRGQRLARRVRVLDVAAPALA